MLDLSLPGVKIPHNGRRLLLAPVLRCLRRRLHGGVPWALRLRRRHRPRDRRWYRALLVRDARRPRVPAQDATGRRPGAVGGWRSGRSRQRQGRPLLLLLLSCCGRSSCIPLSEVSFRVNQLSGGCFNSDIVRWSKEEVENIIFVSMLPIPISQEHTQYGL